MTQTSQRGGTLVSLLVDVLLPAAILTLLSSEQRLGPFLAFALAMLFPLGHGLLDLRSRGRFNRVAVLGLCGVLASALVFLKSLDPAWIAVKEAAVPGTVGILLVVTELTGPGIASGLFLKTINLAEVEAATERRGTTRAFRRTVRAAAFAVVAAMLLSALLNYLLAKWVVTSPPGTEAFNKELARMAVLSTPVIFLPTTTLILTTGFVFLLRVRKLTALAWSTLLRPAASEKNANKEEQPGVEDTTE